jgi:hypothetical protein
MNGLCLVRIGHAGGIVFDHALCIVLRVLPSEPDRGVVINYFSDRSGDVVFGLRLEKDFPISDTNLAKLHGWNSRTNGLSQDELIWLYDELSRQRACG